FGGGTFYAGSTQPNAFVAKYTGAGAHLWSAQVDGTGWDGGFGTAFDGSGNLTVTGTTSGGNFAGVPLPSAGGMDIFLLKLGPAEGQARRGTAGDWGRLSSAEFWARQNCFQRRQADSLLRPSAAPNPLQKPFPIAVASYLLNDVAQRAALHRWRPVITVGSKK